MYVFFCKISFTSVWLLYEWLISYLSLACAFFRFFHSFAIVFFSLFFELFFTTTSTNIRTQTLRGIQFCVHWLVLYVLVESPIRLNEQHSQTSCVSTIVTYNKKIMFMFWGLFPIRICEPIRK